MGLGLRETVVGLAARERRLGHVGAVVQVGALELAPQRERALNALIVNFKINGRAEHWVQIRLVERVRNLHEQRRIGCL